MYNGKNKTALNSQLRIKDAFISMLKYSSFDTILIKDICKKANISRQRFYYLYKSKEEIISHILNDFFSNMLDDIKIRNINSLFDLINIFYLSIDANEDIQYIFAIENTSNIAENIFVNYLNQIHMIKVGHIMNLNDLYAHHFLASGFIHLYNKWCKGGKDIPIEYIIQLAFNIITGQHFKDENNI